LTADVPTYLLERGDERRPNKEIAITPGTPEVFGSSLKVEPIELPVLEYYPALQEFALKEDTAQVADHVAAAEKAAAAADMAVAAAQKQLDSKSPADAGASQAKLIAGNGQSVNPAKPGANQSNSAANVADSRAELHQAVDRAVATAELAMKQLASARAAQVSLAARIAADKAKYGLTPGADLRQLVSAANQAQRELALCQAQEQQISVAQELAISKAKLKANDPASAKTVEAAEKKVTDAATALAKAHAASAVAGETYEPLGAEIPHQSTGRRLAFARWLVNRNNPLTARVAINHIWLRHFGAPLVDNMFDFGLRSPRPRNQALLDWLAVELMENGWQMKHIHRLLVTSSAYRMSSSSAEATPVDLTADRDNQYLWRMNSRRLEAEAVRDCVFFTAGDLDLKRGGPDIAYNLANDTPRRSIYFQYADEKMNQLLQIFDNASVNECYRRNESVVPQQALAMANSDVCRNQSRLLAKKLSESSGQGDAANGQFVRTAYEQILGRDPTSTESDECEKFLETQTAQFRNAGSLTPIESNIKATVAPSGDPTQRARESLTLVLYNHNDFITVR
jgi:hypothetical protein